MDFTQTRNTTIALRRRKAVLRDDQGGYQPAHARVYATLYPMDGHLAFEMYGMQIHQMMLLITEPNAPIAAGMGICAFVPPDSSPDFRVEYVARWRRHVSAHVRFIPEAERGREDE